MSSSSSVGRLLVPDDDALSDTEADWSGAQQNSNGGDDASASAALLPPPPRQHQRSYTARNIRAHASPKKVAPLSPTSTASTTFVESWLGRNSGVLWLFTLCQILIFYDRGMVAGFLPAVQHDVGELTDTEAGILGSGFIFGYMLACPLFAFFSKSYSPYKLMSFGLFLWSCATVLCGFTFDFSTLLFARILTGVGEASFAGLAPTCIDDVAPVAHRTIWLSFFFAGIPLGSAIGYIAGGYFAKLGWHVGFLIESLAMLPLVAVVFFWNATDMNGQMEAQTVAQQKKPFRRTNSWARIPVPARGALGPRITAGYGSIQQEESEVAVNVASPSVEATAQSSSAAFSRSISTPALRRLEDGSAIVIPPPFDTPVLDSTTSTPARRTADMPRSEERKVPTLQVNVAGYPSSYRPDARRARTPAIARTYIVPDPSNPYHAPGLPSSSSTSSTSSTVPSGYNEVSFTHTIPQDHLNPVSPANYLPSPGSYNPHYTNVQRRTNADDDDMFVTDILTLLTDGVYIVVVLGYAALAFVIGALSFWGPVDFSKNLHIGLGRSTRMIGAITFFSGLGGTFFGGWCLDYRGGSKGIFAVISALEICCVFTTLAIGFAMAAVLAMDLTISMVCLGLADFFLFATGAPVNASLLSVAPKNMRSLAMAMSILLMHALGDLPSPFLMGLITDQVGSIQLALMCLCAWLLWTVLFWGIGVLLSRKRAEAFKAQLRHDMSIPAGERSALLRRGSTGQFVSSNQQFYDALQSRPSQHRPFQYYDSDENVRQPYTAQHYGAAMPPPQIHDTTHSMGSRDLMTRTRLPPLTPSPDTATESKTSTYPDLDARPAAAKVKSSSRSPHPVADM